MLQQTLSFQMHQELGLCAILHVGNNIALHLPMLAVNMHGVVNIHYSHMLTKVSDATVHVIASLLFA